MNKIYIVTGSSGDYDDYREWRVKAFYDKSKAEEFRNLANKEIDAFSARKNELYKPYEDIMKMTDKEYELYWESIKFHNKYDPNSYSNQTDVLYNVEELEIE